MAINKATKIPKSDKTTNKRDKKEQMGKREYNKGRQKCATIKATKATKKR